MSLPDEDEIAQRIAGLALGADMTIAVAESLTGGLVASALAAADQASQWFRGGIVAYTSEVKHTLLTVPPGPVVSEAAVRAMAGAVREMFAADLAVALSGVGGPDPQDGLQPGSVWFAVASRSQTDALAEQLAGADPTAICHSARRRALELLEGALR